MHETKPLPALLLLLTLAASPAPAQAPEKPCADPIPKDCKSIKFLGEDKGCACFACNPGTKERKVVCTKSEEDKKTLRKLLQEPTPPAAQPAPAPRGNR
jgi:hypothetical protein